MDRKVLFIVGPTASGKTRLSIEIAKLLGTEVISADSRQMFKYLDIGTAKPEQDEMLGVPHHFIDVYEPDYNYNAGKFSKEARIVVEQLFASGKFPVVCGGSGLYVKALIDGFSVDNISDARVRIALKNRLDREGAESLYKQLQQVDPVSAADIHPNNVQRVMRALEIYILTGKKVSESKQRFSDKAHFQSMMIGLDWDRNSLYKNIDSRVDKMIEKGLIAEVAILYRKGYDENLNSLQTVGYKEVFDYFNGDLNFEEMIKEIKKNTRNYAKRQLTWFRNDERVEWLKINAGTDYRILAHKIIDRFKNLSVDPQYISENEEVKVY